MKAQPTTGINTFLFVGSVKWVLDDGARAVLGAGGLDALLAALADGPPRVAVAAARALKQLLAVRLALPRCAALRSTGRPQQSDRS